MLRPALFGLVALCAAGVWGAVGRQADPFLYELVINGEPFTVEANRTNQLESKRQPGTKYEVALRIAQNQRLILNTLQFDYDRGCQVTDDRKRDTRTATLNHELGFTIVLSDLGIAMDETGRRKMLAAVQASMQKKFLADKAQNLTASEPFEDKFGQATALGTSIRFKNPQGVAHTCLVYVLGDAKSTCTCVVQYLDADEEDSLPLIKHVLDTIRTR